MKTRKLFIMLLAAISMVLVISGSAGAADEITITDMIGREVTVTPAPIRR